MISCRELFGEYLDDNLKSVFDDTLVKECQLDMENRILTLSLLSKDYIKSENILSFKNRITAILKLTNLDFSLEFENPTLTAEAVEDIALEIRRKNASLNGYLAGAEYRAENNIDGVSDIIILNPSSPPNINTIIGFKIIFDTTTYSSIIVQLKTAQQNGGT